MGRKKKLAFKSCIAEHDLEAIARCLIPDILADFENEDIQREFAEWQAQQSEKKAA